MAILQCLHSQAHAQALPSAEDACVLVQNQLRHPQEMMMWIEDLAADLGRAQCAGPPPLPQEQAPSPLNRCRA